MPRTLQKYDAIAEEAGVSPRRTLEILKRFAARGIVSAGLGGGPTAFLLK